MASFQAQLKAALEEDQDERQHSKDANHHLKVAGINPLQDGTKSDADQQQDDDVRYTRPAGQAVRNHRDHEECGGQSEYASHIHEGQTCLGMHKCSPNPAQKPAFLAERPRNLRSAG